MNAANPQHAKGPANSAERENRRIRGPKRVSPLAPGSIAAVLTDRTFSIEPPPNELPGAHALTSQRYRKNAGSSATPTDRVAVARPMISAITIGGQHRCMP